jgi:hypothetical protein
MKQSEIKKQVAKNVAKALANVSCKQQDADTVVHFGLTDVRRVY